MPPLDANTTYELAIVDDMGATTTTFTTGPAADLVPPGAVTVSDLAVAHAIYQPPVLSSCGEDLTSFRGVVAGLADVATLGIRFTGANAVQERVVFARETPLLLLGMGHCNIRLDVVPGETYDVEVWARDLAGNSGPIYREQITVRACAPVPMYYDFDFDLNDCPLADDESDGGGCAAGGPGAAPWLAVIGLGWLIRRRRARSKR